MNKQNNSKRFASFSAGMAVMALLTGLVGSALAAGGGLTYSQIGVHVFGQQEINAGESYTAPNGQQVPASISYTDEIGGLTNYLSVRQISELLDADITWNSSTNTVEIASGSSTGQPSVSVGGQVVITGSGKQDSTSDTAGPFRLVATKTPAATTSASYLLKNARFQSESDFEQLFHCLPEDGKYINVSITNNNTESKENLIVNLYRHKTIGKNELFPSFQVKPGETVTKTIMVDKSAAKLTGWLGLDITYDAGENYKIDSTISAIQFD